MKRCVDAIHCRRLGNCLIGRHANAVESHQIGLIIEQRRHRSGAHIPFHRPHRNGRKQREKEEKEREKKEQEEALEVAMPNRLAQLGFKNDEIEAFISPHKGKLKELQTESVETSFDAVLATDIQPNFSVEQKE
jgi:hypothetical protein